MYFAFFWGVITGACITGAIMSARYEMLFAIVTLGLLVAFIVFAGPADRTDL